MLQSLELFCGLHPKPINISKDSKYSFSGTLMPRTGGGSDPQFLSDLEIVNSMPIEHIWRLFHKGNGVNSNVNDLEDCLRIRRELLAQQTPIQD